FFKRPNAFIIIIIIYFHKFEKLPVNNLSLQEIKCLI
ncbi:uncharacterized protein METZ01_LOCUS465960, partial [marine metagenome]